MTDLDYDPRADASTVVNACSRCSAATTRARTRRRGCGRPPPTAPGSRSRSCTGATSRSTASAPALLVGYGAYEHSSDPAFRASRVSLLDRGFVCAIAHVRGGGELGRGWYEDGRLDHKANTFTDFIACAETFDRGAATRRRPGSSRAAAAPAACSWARSPTCGPTCSRRSSPRCRSSTSSPRCSTRPPAHDHRVGGVGRPAGPRRPTRA